MSANAMTYNGVECACGWVGKTLREFDLHREQECPL